MHLQDELHYMEAAYREAQKAAKKGEAPIGAVIVKDGKIIAKGHNLREKKQNVLRHAEIDCLSKACKKLKSWRLCDCILYVTLEPCIMCAGAITQARIQAVVFGAYDPKAGAAGSITDVFSIPALNHHVIVKGGIMKEKCGKLLTDFFKKLRISKKKEET